MLIIFSNEFAETETYFTNEVTDGRPSDSLITNNKDELWSFDAAVIPEFLFEKYRDLDEEILFNEYVDGKIISGKKIRMEY